jgi:hypothetical protein
VIRINAEFYVAAVAYLHIFGDRRIVEFIGKTMRSGQPQFS